MKKIASILIIIYITSSTIIAQDSGWFTLVSGTIKLTGGYTWQYSSCNPYSINSPCNGCTDPTFNYSGTYTSKVTSITVGAGGIITSGTCEGGYSSEITEGTTTKSMTFGSCTVGFEATAHFIYVPKLSIEVPNPDRSTSENLVITVNGIDAYSFSSSVPYKFQVSQDGTNWYDLNNISSIGNNQRSISWTELNKGDNEDWLYQELKIRIVQTINGTPYPSTPKSFKFYKVLELSNFQITPNCSALETKNGKFSCEMINAQKNNNGIYPKCVTLYNCYEATTSTCPNGDPVPVGNKSYCKGYVEYQSPQQNIDSIYEPTREEYSSTTSQIELTGIKADTYLLEVYNGRYRAPAYEIIEIKSNTFNGNAIPKVKYGVYDLASCDDDKATITLSINGENTKGNYSYSVGSLSGNFDNLNTTKEIELEASPSPGHTITFKDGHGCESKKTLPITKVPDFSCNIEKKDDITCYGSASGSLKFSTSGGFGNNDSYTYAVSKDDVPYSNYIRNGDILQNLSAGTYKVSITDESGCKKEAPSSINLISPTPVTLIAKPFEPECNNGSNGSITFTPNGGTPNYTITVLDNATNTEFASYTDLTAGVAILKGGYTGGKTYNVSISDKNNCSGAKQKITIQNPPEITIDNLLQSKAADCSTSFNGEATFDISNLSGRTPTFYNFNNIEITNIANVSGSSYLWTGLGLGSSQIKVKAGNCPSPLASVTILQKSPSIKLSFDPSPADCEGNHNGSIRVNVLNGVAGLGYTYVLTDESGLTTTAKTADATYTFPKLEGNKTYNFDITDGLGCIATGGSAVSLDPNHIQLNTPGLENAFCSDNPSGKITVSRVGGTGHGNITYTLLGENANGTGDNDIYTFSGLLPKKYTVQALDNSNSCIATKEITLNANPNPISINFSDTIHQSCNEVTNGQMRITATSIGPNSINYGIDSIYNLSLGEKTNSNTILYTNKEAVKYTFKVIDKNKCTATQSFQILNKNNNPFLKIDTVKFKPIDSLFCSNDQTGVIRFKISQKERHPVYKFYKNGVLNSTDSTFNNLSSTQETFRVQDADGCYRDTAMGVPVLKNSIRFSPVPYFTHASCVAAKNGTIKVRAVNGFPFTGGNYKYSINTGKTITGVEAVFDSLESGKDYLVSVLDAKNCLLNYEKIPIGVIKDSLRLDIPNTTDATCIEKATGHMVITRLNGTSFRDGFHYFISDSAGKTVSAQQAGDNNVIFKNLKTGRYSVSVSDSNKCSVSQSFKIGYTPLFNVNSITSYRIPKYGTRDGMIRAIVTQGNKEFEFRIFKANGLPATNPLQSGTKRDTITIRNLYSGTYAIHIRDSANCVVDQNTGNVWFIDTVTVEQPSSALALQIANQKNVACYGDSTASVQLLAEGGYPDYRYAINKKENFQREPLFGNLPKGSYEIFVRDDAGIDTSVVVNITQPLSPLTPSLVGTNRTSCYNYTDGKASLNITGGTSPYSVSLDSINWQSDAVLVGLKANKYRAWVRDANNCFATLANIIVNQPDSISVASQTITNTPCLKNEGAINVTGVTGGNGGYSYVWYKKDSVIGSQPTLSDLFSGRYKLRITDKEGCKGDTAFFVSDISNIWVNFTTTPINCWGKANGKAELTVVKDALPLSEVQWPGKPLSLFATTELDSGVHRVVIVDNQRCQKDTTFTINTISRIAIPEVWRNNPLCLGRSDGSLRVQASGGNPGYNYSWGKYGSGNEITNLLPGTYNVSVTDANNCLRAFDFTLDYQKVEKPQLGKDLVLCSKSDYILNPGNYLRYNWSLDNKPQSTDSVLVVRQPGTYIVNVESDEQCLGSDTLKVDFSNEEMLSDFLMTTQAYVGDTIMLVEISRPLPDSVTWILSPGCKLIDYGQYFKQIALTDTGIYKYALIAHYKGCSDMVEKYVEVIPSDGSNSKKKSAMDDLFKSVSLYPNPTSGQFTAEILLQRKSDLLMKIVNLGTGITEYIRSSKGSDIYTENFSLKLMPGMHVLYLQAGNSSRTVNIMVR